MLIADTSIWIDYFNGKKDSYTELLDTLLTHDLVYLLDVILQETLQGFKSEKDYLAAQEYLTNYLVCLPCLGQENAIYNAQCFRKLRQRGITIRKSNDVMTAGFCLRNDYPLLFRDKDFRPFVEHLGLIDAYASTIN